MEYFEFEKKLRQIVRVADTFGYTREDVLEALNALAENYRRVGEHLEAQLNSKD